MQAAPPPSHHSISDWYQNRMHCKAVRVEILNRFLCKHIVKQAPTLQHADEVGTLRATASWAYETMHITLDEAGLFLDDDQVAQFNMAGHTFLTTLQKLAEVDVKHIWKLRPKHHGLDHMMLDMLTHSRINPKKTSCLLEEDFLGKMKHIGMYCRGVSPLAMSGRLLDRYMLSMALRWHFRIFGIV